MMIRCLFLVALVGCTVALAGCGGEPPPPPLPPTVVNLTLKAGPSANPDGSGTPKPVRVRVLQLKSPSAFAQADFFAIDGDPAAVLGGDLLAAEEFIVPPGGEQVWEATLEDGARVIGVIAAYYAADRVQWRGWTDVPPNRTTQLVAELGDAGVSLRGVGS